MTRKDEFMVEMKNSILRRNDAVAVEIKAVGSDNQVMIIPDVKFTSAVKYYSDNYDDNMVRIYDKGERVVAVTSIMKSWNYRDIEDFLRAQKFWSDLV